MIRLGSSPANDLADPGLPSERIDASAGVMALLRARVPLSLLLDLAEPDGPDSREILLSELVADDVRRDLAQPADTVRDFLADLDVC